MKLFAVCYGPELFFVDTSVDDDLSFINFDSILACELSRVFVWNIEKLPARYAVCYSPWLVN